MPNPYKTLDPTETNEDIAIRYPDDDEDDAEDDDDDYGTDGVSYQDIDLKIDQLIDGKENK